MSRYFITRADSTRIEKHVDLMRALRRSRQFAESLGETTEVRDEQDFILAVSVTNRKTDGGSALGRASRHNASKTLEKERTKYVAEKCPVTEERHAWFLTKPDHRGVWRCRGCDVLGYAYNANKKLPHRCSVCADPATVERAVHNPRHRWSCRRHAEF